MLSLFRSLSSRFDKDTASIICNYIANLDVFQKLIFHTAYLDSSLHGYTHSWATFDTHSVKPLSVSVDESCLGRVRVQFQPKCRDESPFVIEMEPESHWRPVENPTELKCLYTLDGLKRELKVSLDKIAYGANGRRNVRVKQHEWMEWICFSFKNREPLIWCDGQTSIPSYWQNKIPTYGVAKVHLDITRKREESMFHDEFVHGSNTILHGVTLVFDTIS